MPDPVSAAAVVSLRERVLQALVASVTPVAAAHGAAVIRSPTTAVSREQSPALLVIPESESITPRINDLVERQLVVRLVAIARETAVPDGLGGFSQISPETIADRILVAAHAAVFCDPGIASLCLGLREMEVEWEVEDADAVAAALPARYQFTYRTLANDISMQG
jgi:hypothetical protein